MSVKTRDRTEDGRRKRVIHERINGLVTYVAERSGHYGRDLHPAYLREALAAMDVICFLKGEIQLLEQRRLELATNVKERKERKERKMAYKPKVVSPIVGATKDEIVGLVCTLASQLEEEYRRDCGDGIDPHVLALNETRNFVKELYQGTKTLWEAAVMTTPQSAEAAAKRERTRQAMKCLRCHKCKRGSK